MRARQVGLVVIAALVLSVLQYVMPTPVLVPVASAQVDCTPTTEAELRACILAYNSAASGTTTTIVLQQDFTYTEVMAGFNNQATPPAKVTIEGNGHTIDGGGQNFRTISQFDGDLTIRNLTVTGSTASGHCFFSDEGPTLITGSTFHGCDVGLELRAGTALATVEDSTITGNRIGLRGEAFNGAVVRRSTFVANTESAFSGEPSGISFTLVGSLVGANGTQNCPTNGSPVQFVTEELNAFDDDSCYETTETVGLAGTFATTLSANGCVAPCTHTLALGAGSPALDLNTGCASGLFDQRGVERGAGACDAGAYEERVCADAIGVTNRADLAFAIACYNAALTGTTVTATLANDITLAGSLGTIENLATPPAKFVLNGNGYTIDGSFSLDDVLRQAAGDSQVNNVTLTRGNDDGFQVGGGVAAINASTISGNGYGAFAMSGAQLTVARSTIAGNTFDGLFLSSGSTTFLERSSVVWNGDNGIFGSGTIIATSALLAGNLDGQCTSVTSFQEQGTNAIEDDSCSGTATPGLAGTVSDTLAANGCTEPCTHTAALDRESPAIDADLACPSELLDQRGESRTAGRCDAGAFEFGDCRSLAEIATEDDLRFAILCYSRQRFNFDSYMNLQGPISLTQPLPVITAPADPSIQLALDGNGHTVDASGQTNVFAVDGGQLSLVAMTLTGATGAAVEVTTGEASVSLSTVTGNEHGLRVVGPGTASLRRSTAMGNSAEALVSTDPDSNLVVERSTAMGGQVAAMNIGGDASIYGSLVASESSATCVGEVASQITESSFPDDSCGNSFNEFPTLLDFVAPALAQNDCTLPCTFTLALLPGSPAIGRVSFCSGFDDQRGVARGDICDSGAFELHAIDEDLDGSEGPLGADVDCNDQEPTVFPGAQEVAFDSIDQDCDGVDSFDGDGDGFDAITSGGTDCADFDPDAFPGAEEVPYDSVDQDCDGSDLVDVDNDGFDSQQVFGGTDCDDGDPLINPSASEIANDGIDQDCDGNDLFAEICNGLAVTIDMNTNGGSGVGTPGDDVILGTPGNDVITAGEGNDTICAGFGNDDVRGEAGNDTIFGSDGNDKLYGAQGADMIHGGNGDDVIHGNRGDDTLIGGDGNDRMFGYAHNDTIDGGAGDDRLHGNFGDDVIDGGEGADRIFGYGDADTLNGGPGNDLISGNFGDDIINGGADDDTLFGADGDDIVNGNSGNDAVNGNSLNDTLTGGPGDDTLDGGINNDSCSGGPGADTATRCETEIGIP